MSEENNNEKISETERTVNDSQKLTEDAQGLGPKEVGPFRIGVVDMIVGEGGAEVPAFVATKNEILQLAMYWATKIIDLDFTFFVYGSSGSSEWRTREFATRRLDTICELIGEEEVTKTIRLAEEAFGQGVGQRAWRIFTEGTEEEQEQFRQRVQEKLARGTGGAGHGMQSRGSAQVLT